MKKINLLIAVIILAITFGCEMNAHNQSITVKSDEESYSFKAEYPKHKTNEVITYVEQRLQQDDFFSNAEGIKDENVTLSDSSRFYLSSEPGYLKINFSKQDNSEAAYQKLVTLCMGVKEQLK